VVLRRLAGDDPDVNEEWNCDKGRWAFTYATQGDRITTPLIRGEDGEQAPASWSEALTVAAKGLSAAYGNAGVVVGGRATVEDAYAYAKFARVVLGSNDIDFRARAHSEEEADFLAAAVAGQQMTVTYADLQTAPVVLLAGLEPEEESPIIYLRLRKAARTHHTRIYALAPFATRGLTNMAGTLLPTPPGAEATRLDELATGAIGEQLHQPGAVIMVGERLATSPGALSAAARLADATGAKLAWVPRRAGERGAADAGALYNLLPGGRPATDPTARAQLCAAWNITALPTAAGRGTDQILAGADHIGALLIGGVELADLPDPAAAAAALDAAPFVVSLEIRRSTVTDRADVVFPVSPVVEKAGTYRNWEGRPRPFEPALPNSGAVPDMRVLHMIADEMGVEFGLPHPTAARDELAQLATWDGPRPDAPTEPPGEPPAPGPGQAILASWRMLLDAGRLQDGEPHLAGTARQPVARLSAATATEIGATHDHPVTIGTEHGSITLPLQITDMPDRVVWLPMNSPGSAIHQGLRTTEGATVTIEATG
jgi:NADH-quinone oxidoreductase subunit G